MTKLQPTIVFVPGSFSPRIMYAIFEDHIKLLGHDILILDLPSSGRREGLPPATMAEDAQHVHDSVQKVLDSGTSVILVTHSYGGIPGTESLRGLATKKSGATGAVVERVIYVTSVVPPIGGSLTSELGGGNGEVSYLTVGEDGYMTHEIISSGAVNFSNLSPEEGVEEARRFIPHSAISFAGELTYAGYLDFSITYILCTEDKTLLPEFQRRIVERMVGAGAEVDVCEVKADHCWNASVPRSMARRVVEIIGKQILV